MRSVDVRFVRTLLDDFFRVEEAELAYELPNGRMSEVVRLLSFERGDSAAAVVVDGQAGKVILTRQFRFPTVANGPGWMLELVAGSVEDNETPHACVLREIAEELGYEPTSVTPISTFYTSPGGSSERVHLFHAAVSDATLVGPGGGNEAEHENIERIEVPLALVPQLLASGLVVDAKTIIGLTWLTQTGVNVGAGYMRTGGRRTCFVMMPYGKKTDSDGNVIDFESVYSEVIVESVEAMGFEVVRSDKIPQAGGIHKDMFTHIAVDDLAIVDLTNSSPNVFYELGVRHALKPSVTILIKAQGSFVPFNVQDERIIEYPVSSGSVEETCEQIKRFIATGFATNKPDSPIFNILQDARRDWKRDRLTTLDEHAYRLVAQPDRQISVVTGDLREQRQIDVWVNSENTNMQMARFYDRSVSAMIRYAGAEKDDNGEVIDDTIAKELTLRLNGRESVTPGTVYVTGSGALASTNQVKRIFHAATAHGVPGGGYRLMQNVETCVTACLRRMETESQRAGSLHTIVFPMIGTGEGGGDVNDVAPRLIQAAISYLRNKPDSQVTKVYFSAWSQRDLDACQATLTASDDVEPVA
jgi:nudix-type nucleoside diphosphatase (YffH/AdpP family)